jgi:hypothetical protein
METLSFEAKPLAPFLPLVRETQRASRREVASRVSRETLRRCAAAPATLRPVELIAPGER